MRGCSFTIKESQELPNTYPGGRISPHFLCALYSAVVVLHRGAGFHKERDDGLYRL